MKSPRTTLENIAGVAANHSSTQSSTEHTANADHAQSDDAEANIASPADPNISGRRDMQALADWQAGPMSYFQDNEDYPRFQPASYSDPADYRAGAVNAVIVSRI